MKLYYDKPETLSAAISGERRGIYLKPIIFNTEMVRAILDGRKTVTRRVIKPQPLGRIAYIMAGYKHGSWSYPGADTYKYWGDKWKEPEGLSSEERNRHWAPPYQVGDILYVRETWGDYRECTENGEEAARIWLRVTDVRVERLLDMTDEDARQEGCQGTPCDCKNAYIAGGSLVCTDCLNTGFLEPPLIEFMFLWSSAIKKQDLNRYGWDANPWVWVIEFERCENPELLEVNDNG